MLREVERLRSRKEIIVAKTDYVPPKDATYDTWLSNFVSVLNANMATLGLVAADLVPIQTAQNDFNTAFITLTTQRFLEKAAVATKVTTRDESEAILRPLVQRIQSHPGMTDSLRSQLGLRTDMFAASALPLEEIAPNLLVETKIGQVTVHWGPNPEYENRNGKPDGVRGANVYRKKAGEDDFTMVGFATTSPFLDTISGETAEYTYVVRYRGKKPSDLSAPSVEWSVAARGTVAA